MIKSNTELPNVMLLALIAKMSIFKKNSQLNFCRGLQDIRDQLGSEKRNRQHLVLTSGRISTTMGKREGCRPYRTPGGPPLPGLGPLTLGMGSATCA